MRQAVLSNSTVTGSDSLPISARIPSVFTEPRGSPMGRLPRGGGRAGRGAPISKGGGAARAAFVSASGPPAAKEQGPARRHQPQSEEPAAADGHPGNTLPPLDPQQPGG